MKIKLTEAQEIKGVDHELGDEVIVTKKLGERLISCGKAEDVNGDVLVDTGERVIEDPENRVIEVPENRMRAVRFSGHKKIFQGSDGKKYVLKGKDYVEVEE